MKKLDQHHHAAEHEALVARHVHAGKRHVRRADQQRHDVIAERRERQRHDAQKHHDRPVHRAEGIVKVGGHRAPGGGLAENFFHQPADGRDRLARMRHLPAHQQHQEKSEQHETQRSQTVLDADDLVVGGKNVGAPEAEVFVMPVLLMAVCPPCGGKV